MVRWRRVAHLDVVDVNFVIIVVFIGRLLLLVLIDVVGRLRSFGLLQLGDLCALVIFNFHLIVRFRSLFLGFLEPLDEGGGLVMDLLGQLLRHILLGHLLGPLKDDFFLKNVLSKSSLNM